MQRLPRHSVHRFHSGFFVRRPVASMALALSAASIIATGSAWASALPQLTMVMNGKSIVVGGTFQSGAVDVITTTAGAQEAQPLLLRLNPGITPQQALTFTSSPAARNLNNISRIGSIVLDAQVGQGVRHIQTTLQPGQYVAFDLSRGNPSDAPHAAFTVSQAAEPAALPAPQATISAIDFGFRAPTTLHDGELVRFANDGYLVHMIVATAAPSARAAKRVAAALQTGDIKTAKRLSIGGTTFADPLSPGSSQQQTIAVRPGYWILASFITVQDGRPDSQLGMERIIRIAR